MQIKGAATFSALSVTECFRPGCFRCYVPCQEMRPDRAIPPLLTSLMSACLLIEPPRQDNRKRTPRRWPSDNESRDPAGDRSPPVRTGVFSMSTKYSLTVTNNSTQFQDLCVYQK